MSEFASKLYTAEQVRCLDACAINEHGIPGYELMKRAGRAVFDAAESRFPAAVNWAVVCGAGNNAGDGYVIARLALDAGKSVCLYTLGPPEELKGDARTAAQDFLKGNSVVHRWPPVSDHEAPELVIDALLGTGLDRPVKGEYRKAIDWMNIQRCPGFAVDIPSGLNADTGQVMGIAFRSDFTISFIGIKQGLITCDGPDYTGELVFDSLDIPCTVYESISDSGFIIRENLLTQIAKHRKRNSHKGQYGHVLVAGGNAGMAGAVRLAGEAALRCGSGLVTIATHPVHSAVLNLARPELMVNGVSETGDMTALLKKATVVAVGPGLGLNDWSRELFLNCLGSERPLLVDADGLNLLAEKPCSREKWILTPHPAEAGRLLGISTEEIQANRVDSARKLAAKYGGIVVLKGCGTVLAEPNGGFAICPLGNPGMATAGSGDVLTGIIASLLGQCDDPWNAAQAGVVAHAAAGDHAAAILGERGMLAGDIIESLPQVLR